MNQTDNSQKDKVQTTNKYVGKHSPTATIREIPIKNFTEIPAHICQNDYYQESKQQCWFWENGPLYPAVGDGISVTTIEINASKQLKIELLFEPPIPLLGVYIPEKF